MPFHYGSISCYKIQPRHLMREVVVILRKWNGYSGRLLCVGSVGNNNSNANGNNNINNNNGRLVGIVKLIGWDIFLFDIIYHLPRFKLRIQPFICLQKLILKKFCDAVNPNYKDMITFLFDRKCKFFSMHLLRNEKLSYQEMYHKLRACLIYNRNYF